MTESSGLVARVANASLEKNLRARLGHGRVAREPAGDLKRLAVRLGLIQDRVEPSFFAPSLVMFAADHGLAVDNIAGSEEPTTIARVQGLLTERLPLARLSRLHGLNLMVVDSGVADAVEPHARLHPRKIAHGTRNSRVGKAMSLEQVQAAIRAGIEIGESLQGNVVACAGIGVGSAQTAALLLSSLSNVPLSEFVDAGPSMPEGLLDHTLAVLDSVHRRHLGVSDPIELLAAMGGFEVAMMVGLMLSASARRFVVLPDGLPACAALIVAAAVAPAVVDYCIHTRSNQLPGLDRALSLFDSSEVLAGSTDGAMDGTGAALAWPVIEKAAALLSAAD